MQQIEQFIKEIPLLTRQQRAKLREAALKHIAGTHDMPQAAAADIEKEDWLKVRRMAMQERYAGNVASKNGKPEKMKHSRTTTPAASRRSSSLA